MFLIEGLQRYQRAKLEFKKNICRSAWFKPMRPGSAELPDIFSELQIWPLTSLQPLDQNQSLVPHLKDQFHICLEPKAQGCGMTFNRFYVGTKYPYFISYRGKWVYLFCRSCTHCILSILIAVLEYYDSDILKLGPTVIGKNRWRPLFLNTLIRLDYSLIRI